MKNPRRKIAFVAAFAAAVAATQMGGDEPSEPAPRTEVECLAPVGPGADFSEFRWQYALPEGGTYELRLYDPSYNLLGALPDLTETTWSPDPAVAEQMPDELTWEVFARDAEGQDLSNGRAEAQR